MKKLRVLFLSLLLAGAALAAAHANEAKELHVVVVSIDALRPEFYLSDEWETPVLKSLVKKGAAAEGVQAAYPSVTYAGHASIMTGDWPAKHGIDGNTLFDEHGAQPEWHWETSDLTAKPLWQAAKEQGRKVAIMMWPTTVGAKVDWLVPERWGVRGESTKALLFKHSTPGLLLELANALGVSAIDSSAIKDPSQVDEFVAKSTAYILGAKKPDLMILHLIQVDEAAHSHGRSAPEVHAAVARQDANIGIILEGAKKAGIADKTVIVIVGDHGFTDVEETIYPNTLLAQADLVQLGGKGDVESWRALGHAHGGSMAIYAKDEEAQKKARELLEKNRTKDGVELYRIIERAKLDELGADPKACFWLDAAEGKGFAGQCQGALVRKHPLRGTHGGLPTRAQLFTGFIACGPGVRHAKIPHMRLVDEAPTVARLMGVELPPVDGAVLDVLDEEPY
jgi:predicted AlkP superfamily pyrophosphatase or phosphodiesterase